MAKSEEHDCLKKNMLFLFAWSTKDNGGLMSATRNVRAINNPREMKENGHGRVEATTRRRVAYEQAKDFETPDPNLPIIFFGSRQAFFFPPMEKESTNPSFGR